MKVLVAGAGGHVGRHTVDELKRRGHWVRALVRNTRDTWTEYPDEVVSADVNATPDVRPVCDGVDLIFSAIGGSLSLKSRDKTPYKVSDEIANSNLLHGAIAANVRQFTYVSVYAHHALGDTAYVSAHESFIQRLRDARMDYQVLRPTGIFYVFGELLELAKKNRALVVGDGTARTNPVHEIDVAVAAVNLIESGDRELEIGGPDILSRADLVRLAFQALGKPDPRIRRIPQSLMRLAAFATRPFNRRMAELLEFGAAVSVTEVVAPTIGTRRPTDYFQELAG